MRPRHLLMWLVALALTLLTADAMSGPGLADSLRQRLPDRPTDTTHVRQLLALAEACYHEGLYDEGISHAITARKLAQRLRDMKGLGNALLLSSYTYKLKGAYHASVNDAREALGVFTYLQDWASMGRCHNFLAQALEQLGQRNEALRHQQTALDLLRKARNDRGVAVVLNGLGVIYYKSGNMGMALRCYWQALRLSDSLKSVVHQGTALNNIANVYDDLGRQETAVAFYERNLALLQDVGVPSAIALAHMQIGNMYLKMDQLSKAEHHLREALALQKKIDDRRRQVFTNSYLGRVYFQRHERAVALYYFLEAYEQARSLGTLEIAIDAMKGLFHYYRYEGKEELAGHYLFEALQTATRYGDRLALLDLYDLRATFEQQRRKPEAAALWKERYLHLRDSLFTPGLGKTVDSLEMAYENEMRSILLTKPPPPSSARLREENKSLYGPIRWITLSLLTLLVVLLALGRHRGAGPHQREQKKAADAIATT